MLRMQIQKLSFADRIRSWMYGITALLMLYWTYAFGLVEFLRGKPVPHHPHALAGVVFLAFGILTAVFTSLLLNKTKLQQGQMLREVSTISVLAASLLNAIAAVVAISL